MSKLYSIISGTGTLIEIMYNNGEFTIYEHNIIGWRVRNDPVYDPIPIAIGIVPSELVEEGRS